MQDKIWVVFDDEWMVIDQVDDEDHHECDDFNLKIKN